MNRSVQDKIAAYIAERGSEGVSSAELARVFLAPASAPGALCEKLIATVLSNDARLAQTPDGQWFMAKGKPIADGLRGEFTVVETVDISAAGRPLPVEWAAVRVDGQGRTAASGDGVIAPGSLPNDAVLPARLRGRIGQGRPMAAAVRAVVELAQGSTIVSVRPGPFQEKITQVRRNVGAAPGGLFLGRLAKQLISRDMRTIEDLAARLGVPVRNPETAVERAAFAAELLSAMLMMKEELGLGDPESWEERQRPQRLDVDFSRYDFDRAFLDALPQAPGVYTMCDANGEVIYVGKALNLRQRAGDYFRARVRRDEKTARIQEAVYAIDVEETGSELAALLAEHRLISELRPRLNVQYDVHDRLAGQRAPSRRWVAVLPAVIPEQVEVFMFYGNRTLRRAVAPRDEPESLRPVLEALFFGPNPPETEAESERDRLRIAWSWLERHRDATNVFDIELAGGLEGTVRLLARYMAEEPNAGKVFHV